MQMCGNRAIVTAYVKPEIYNFLLEEKGSVKMSTYVSELLTAYVDAVKNGEIPEDPNVN